MTDSSARFALPLLEPGQAQKEMTHNEAIAAIDLIVQATALAAGLDTPPATPALGQCWIVGTDPTDAWAGKPRRLAGWTGGGWRFVDPVEGMAVWVAADGLTARFVAGAWLVGEVAAAKLTIAGHQVVGAQEAGIGDPSGGSTVDVEARAGVAAILAALRHHGLIAA